MLSEIWDSGAFYVPLLGKAECCRTMQRRSERNESNRTKSRIDGGDLISAVNDGQQNPNGRQQTYVVSILVFDCPVLRAVSGV